MKYLKRFNENNSDIEIICQQYGIENYKINPDGSVDVDGNVDLSGKNLTKLPIQFGKVTGYFYCSRNLLTSLKGAPMEVGGDFYCSRNLLTSLEGAPNKIGGVFNCNNNELTTLEGGPMEVGGYFYCSNNELTTLEGGPMEVEGSFNCQYNQLTSLEGGPMEVEGSFNCQHNKIRTLEGAPQKVGDFYCDNNPFEVIYQLFKSKFREFLDKINFIYTDFFNGPDMIRGDVLEQIAEELEVELPTKWESQLVVAGYTII